MVKNTNHLSAKAEIHDSQEIPAFEAVAKGRIPPDRHPHEGGDPLLTAHSRLQGC